MIAAGKSLVQIGVTCGVLCVVPGLARAAESQTPGDEPTQFSCDELRIQHTAVASGRAMPDDLRSVEALTRSAALAREDIKKAKTPAEEAAAYTRAKGLDESAMEAKIKAFASVPFERSVEEADTALGNAGTMRSEAEAALAKAQTRLDNRTPEEKATPGNQTEQLTRELDTAKRIANKARQAELAAACGATAAHAAADIAKRIRLLEEERERVLRRAFKEDDAAKQKSSAEVDSLDTQIAGQKVAAVDEWFIAARALDDYKAREADTEAEREAPTDSKELTNGARLSWELAASLLRFHTQRSENLPGRVRTFRPRLELIPGEVGFQFLVEPSGLPWRMNRKNGESLQLMSWGGLLLASLGEDDAFERGSLSLAATVSFFENNIGLGLGFDLYRGIPVLGSDGTPGGDTAFTGVLAWAFAHEGEVTAENAFFVVTLNLSNLVTALSGKEDK